MHEIIFETAIELDKVRRKYGLRYQLDHRTLPGAVRYKGFEKLPARGNGFTNLSFFFSLYKLKEYTFKGYSFFGPNDYHTFLSEKYGDYMMPPPPEDRHFHLYKVEIP